MNSASGCLFVSTKTKRICLQLRNGKGSYGHTWSFWGGKSEGAERPHQTLLREVEEEVGFMPDYLRVYPFHKFTSKDNNFEYNAFIVTVEDEFIPQTNDETCGYVWVDVKYAPKPLHQGAKMVLQNKEMVRKIRTILEYNK